MSLFDEGGRRAAQTLAWVGIAFAVAACNGRVSDVPTLPDGGGISPVDAAGSGQGQDATGPGAATPLPCDVDAVLAANCRTCHASPPLYGAPMPLLTYDDLHAPAKPDSTEPLVGSVAVYQQVGIRIQDDKHPMPPSPDARLDAAAVATLQTWIASGAPAGTVSCAPGTPADAGAGAEGGSNPPAPDDDGGTTATDCIPGTLIRPASPYTMTSPEQYVCYGFDIPASAGEQQVTQVTVHLDNKQIIHHMLLLRSSTSVSGTPAPCEAGPALNDGMLYAWAPGGNALVAPPEAGFPQDQTTHYMVQIHYNNAAGIPNPTDSSGFDLCTTNTLRPYNADVLAFGSEAILLFPHATGEVTSCFTTPSTLDGAHFFAAFPHMHELGVSITTSQLPGGTGAPVDMGTIPAWDFSTQPWLPINTTLHAGDIVKTQCNWDNTTASTVTFGPDTSNEMCFSFTAYYPSLGASYAWPTPAQSSTSCQ